MKKLLLVVVLALIALGSVSWWGGCDLNARLCSAWCEVRHFNAEIKAAGCRARCTTERLRCLAGQGRDGVSDFIEGYRQ